MANNIYINNDVNYINAMIHTILGVSHKRKELLSSESVYTGEFFDCDNDDDFEYAQQIYDDNNLNS